MAFSENRDTQKSDVRFYRSLMREPILERDTEYEYARLWQEEHNEAALHKLVRAHARMVVSAAHKLRNYGLPISDLVQEGSIGLMQAAARFDPNRGVRFSTYAGWWVRASMQDFILRNWSIVRTGTTAAQKALFFNLRRLRARIDQDVGRRMSYESREFIADNLNVALSEVEAMESRLNAGDQSLNAPVLEGEDGSRQDFIPDLRPNPEDVVTGMRDAETRSQWLNEALNSLNEREQKIIRQRRLREQGATLDEIGRLLGVSKERVRQLEARALEKMRDHIERRTDRPTDLLVNA